MPFQIIPPKTAIKPPRVGADDVTVSVRRGPAQRGHVLTVSMGLDVALALTWNEGTRVVIAWGEGSHVGKVKIWPQRSTEGLFWSVRANKALDVFKVHTGALPDTYAGTLYRGASVVHEVIRQSVTEPAPFLTLTLPKGFHERGAS